MKPKRWVSIWQWQIVINCFRNVYIGISVFKKASVIGTFFGALFTSVMLNGFTLMAMPFYLRDLIIAVSLIIAIVLSKIDWTSIQKKNPIPNSGTEMAYEK